MAVALHTLDVWADHVREETERNFYRFTENPAQFHNSESWWRAAMMITVLQQDAGIRYNLTRMQDLSMTHAEDISFPACLARVAKAPAHPCRCSTWRLAADSATRSIW